MIKQVVTRGYFEENAYFYINEKNNHCFLIDPGAEGKKLLDIAEKNNWIIDKILITHGHMDHIGGIDEIRDYINVPVYAFSDKYLLSPHYNLSKYCDGKFVVENAKILNDGEIITLNDSNDFYLKVIHTPGHTEDSVIFLNEEENIAFVGDTIFKGSIGNPNYPGGDIQILEQSIINKIFKLDEKTRLYSGHSDVTTVKEEKERYGIL